MPWKQIVPLTDEDLEVSRRFEEWLDTVRPDGYVNGYAPWWHGWALREAFLAGRADRDDELKRKAPARE